MSFEQAVLVKAGKDAAFAGVLMNPPSSSFEIMHPEAYMAHAPVPVVRLPDIHPLLNGEYVPYDVGVMGELDVRILIELFGGREMADALSPAWNGGVYYAAQRKSATAARKGIDGFAGVDLLLAVEESGFGSFVYADLCGSDSEEVLECGGANEG